MPAKATDEQVISSAQSRLNGRFPTLAYSQKKSGNSIWRCAELSDKCMGFFGQLGGDKALLESICSPDCKLIIYTAREMANRTDDRQYGYESSQVYKNVEKKFYTIYSKVKLTRSFEQVWQLTNNIQEKNIIPCFIKTKWPIMMEEVLAKAFDIVQNLRRNSILIHCPSGADGSCVLSSLAQIILDPYYRTFEGFRILVYKEWLFF